MDIKKLKGFGFITCTVSAFFYCYQYLISIIPSLTVRPLMRQFHANATQVGFINACYYYTFVIMLFFCGPIIDRFKARYIVTIATLLCAITIYSTTATNSIEIAYISRLVMGAAATFGYITMLYLVEKWLNPKWFTLYASLYTSSAEFIITIFSLFFAAFLTMITAATLGIGIGILGIFIAIISFAFIRNAPNKHYDDNKTQTPFISILKQIIVLCKIRQYYVIVWLALLFFIPAAIFSASWGVEFFKSAYHYSASQASVMNALLFLGLAIGTIVFGFLADYIQYRRSQICIFSMIDGCLQLVIIYGIHMPYLLAAVLYFLIGFFAGTNINIYYYAKKICTPEIVATSMAFVTAISNISYMALPPIIGRILDLNWHGKLDHGAKVFGAGTFQISFIIAPIAMIILALSCWMLKPEQALS